MISSKKFNTFPPTTKIAKYFYVSLLDAEAWINGLVLKFDDTTLEYIVLELEIERTKIEN